jgi:hypothetical protein
MLLFPALGGLWDEGRFWPKKRRHFCEILIVNILASEPSFEKILKKFAEMGYSVISKQSDYFRCSKKTAAQTPKKVKILATPSQVKNSHLNLGGR